MLKAIVEGCRKQRKAYMDALESLGVHLCSILKKHIPDITFDVELCVLNLYSDTFADPHRKKDLEYYSLLDVLCEAYGEDIEDLVDVPYGIWLNGKEFEVLKEELDKFE